MYESTIGAAPARISRPAASFASTEFLHDESDADYDGFAPTQFFVADRKGPAADDAWMPAARLTSRWVEAQEVKAVEHARRVQAADAARRASEARFGPSAAAAAGFGLRRRLQARLDRVLPPDSRGVLALFVCVALSVALICSVLPLVDKL